MLNKKIIFSFLNLAAFLLIASVSFGQQDTIIIVYPQDPTYLIKTGSDTLFVDTPSDGTILFGTTIIPITSNQVGLYGAGLWLDNLVDSPCHSSQEPSGIDKNISSSSNDSILRVSLEITSNCCHRFLGDAELVDDSVLNLIYIGYSGNCACYCCVGLTYTFRKEYPNPDIKISHVMINGDKTTMKPISIN